MKRVAIMVCAALLVLLALLPKTAYAAPDWSLDGGVLTISGSGPMADYAAATDAPWYESRGEITSIVIESGVTSVGNNSFTWCEAVTSLTLPQGLTAIGKNAFWGCGALQTLELPDSLERIGTCAFFRSGLTAITIPQQVTELEQGLFGQCGNLKTVTLHDAITVIRKDVFSRCYALEQLTLPAGLESVGEHAFFACVQLKTLAFGAHVTQVGSAPFYGCGNLAQLSFAGKAPYLADDAFLGLTATVSYPAQEESWASVAGNSYGGQITWGSGCRHDYTSVFTEPTCEAGGYSTFTCTLCGYSYVGLPVDALGHSFTNYVSDGNATADADGTKTALCDRGCGAADTVTDAGSRLPGGITTDVYAVDDETIHAIPAGTTVEVFLAGFHQENLRVVKDGEAANLVDLVGTGMVLQQLAGEQVVGGWLIIVTGDVNGDGNISVTDLLMVKSHLLKKAMLEGVVAQAADASHDHAISVTDFLQFKAHLLKKNLIVPN